MVEPAQKRSKTAADSEFASRTRGAILGAHIGDALAFPYHWYYSYDILKEHMAQYYQPDENGWAHGYREVYPWTVIGGLSNSAS